MRCDFPTDDLQELLAYSVLFTDAEYKPALSLFHYTSASNLNSIIKSDYLDLRFTRADHFKDTDEGKHIIKWFKNACKEALINGIIDEHYYGALINVADEYSNWCDVLQACYVFCLSKNDKSQYLIENYAKKNGGEGLIIGLQSVEIEGLPLDKTLGKNEETNGIEIYDVIYDPSHLKSYMIRLIRKAYSLREQDNEKYDLTKKIFYNQLAIYGLVYKSPKYQMEEEMRIVVDGRNTILDKPPFHVEEDGGRLHLTMSKCVLYCRKIL